MVSVSHPHKPPNQSISGPKISEVKVFLVLQVLTVPLVIMLFQLIEPRILAAMLAGLWFCVTSSFMAYRSARWKDFWKRPVFILSVVFSVGVSYPMLLVRALNWSKDFSELSIWGIPGPLFHKLSNYVFLALFVMTFRQFLKLRSLDEPNRNNGKEHS